MKENTNMTSLRTHAEQHNTALYRDYKKDRKVGEGAYAVVYLGTKENEISITLALTHVQTLKDMGGACFSQERKQGGLTPQSHYSHWSC
jgi:hypothetical protein